MIGSLYARTDETKRFPGWAHPPTSVRYIYTCSDALRDTCKHTYIEGFATVLRNQQIQQLQKLCHPDISLHTPSSCQITSNKFPSQASYAKELFS